MCKLIHAILSTVIIVLLPIYLYAQVQTAASTASNIKFLSYLPKDYNEKDDHPLLIFLHGLGERGDNLEMVKKNGPPKLIEEGKWPSDRPFIVLSPQLPSSFTYWPSSIVNDIVEHAKKNYKVDVSRVYITGLSLGGNGAWEYVTNYPYKVAAVVPIAGWGSLSKACEMKDVPVWAFHGDADPTVSVSGSINMVNAINACAPQAQTKPKLTLYPEIGHDSWSMTYDLSAGHDIYTWLLSFTSSAATQNYPPTLWAGEDKIVKLPENNITISAGASDSDGFISSYQWIKISGKGAILEGVTTNRLLVSELEEGTYIFRLTVTDNDGATAWDEVKVTVLSDPKNQAPTVTAGEDKTIQLPQNSLILSGNADDVDGNIVTYLWVKVSGPEIVLNENSQADLKLRELSTGTYIFRLTVTDNKGATASAQVRVTVYSESESLNQPPTANAGEDKMLVLPENSVTLNGSGDDKDGVIIAYQWTKVSGPEATVADADKAMLKLNNLTEGTYTFRITVTDDKGATASDDTRVMVKPLPNQPPTANAGKNQLLHLPNNSIELRGSGIDSDGEITAYQWSKVSGPTASTAHAHTPLLALSDLLAGTYVFRLTVTDDRGDKASDDVQVIVNEPPTAHAGRERTIALPTNSTYLSGSGSDKDGTIVAYAWTKKSGPSVIMKNADTYLLLLDELREGTYVFRLEVTDNRGAKAWDEIMVIVLSENALPIVDAGRDKKIQLPTDNLQIVGSASDPDGIITSYSWTQMAGPPASMIGVNEPLLQLFDLIEGNYTFRLTIRDNVGASAFDEVNVIVERIRVEMFLTFTTIDNKCFGANEGSCRVSVTGGEAPYSYYWSNGMYTSNIDGLGAGNYTVTVTDKSGRSTKGAITIAQPEELNVDTQITNETNRGKDGKIDVNITGGSPPYVSKWSNGIVNKNNEGLSKGEYKLIIQDANGCSVIQSYQVDKIRQYDITIHPNPSYGRFNLNFNNLEANHYELKVYNTHGVLVFEMDNDITRTVQTETLDLSDKGKGIYFIKIIYDAKYGETKRVIVN